MPGGDSQITQFPGFVGGFNRERSIQIDNEITVNLYCINSPRTPEQMVMASMAGLEYRNEYATQGAAMRNNGLFAFENNTYAVIGSDFYSGFSFVATIPSVGSTIFWTYLPTQVVFTDGANIYVYTPTTGAFITVAQPFLVKISPISAINGRVNVPEIGTNIVYVSAENDGSSYDQNTFFIFQAVPDTLQGSAVINGRLLLIGRIHSEVYEPVDTVQIPLQRDNNINIQYGTGAPGSIVTANDQNGQKYVAWLAQDDLGSQSFVASDSTQVWKISSEPVDILVQGFSQTSDCYSHTYRIDGHLFLEWNFPAANYTLVYDATTQLWQSRQMQNGDYFIGNGHAYANGVQYVGSRIDNSLYSMTSNSQYYYSSGQNQEAIHRQRISPIVRNPAQTGFIGDFFQIKFETGYVPPNVSPRVWLQTSRDNRPFDNSRSVSMGQTGVYGHISEWYGLGHAHSMVFKMDIFDPVRCYIMGAAYKITSASR
jgi:hypothetical protein